MGQRPSRPVKLCQLDGCNVEVFVDKSTQTVHNFCSRAHAREAASKKRKGSRGTVSVLKNDDPSYGSLKGQFLSKWQKGANDLTVERIFKIEVAKSVNQKHIDYGRGKSNTRRRFHGTSGSSDCNYFYNLKGSPCERQHCSVCSICTFGFQLKGHVGRTAKARNFRLRFGDGLYFSSVSGKADDYAAQSEKICNGKKWRCMFVATVTVGRAYLTEEGELPDNMCPPQGYDAVVGEIGPNLDHDEVVVYNEVAAIPTYLIVYSTA